MSAAAWSQVERVWAVIWGGELEWGKEAEVEKEVEKVEEEMEEEMEEVDSPANSSFCEVCTVFTRQVGALTR